MKIAICAATPYQTLNVLNFACNILDEKDEKDLFYRNFSEETNKILNVIKKYQIFDNIYEYNLVDKKNKVKYYINDFIQAVFPKKFINVLVRENLKLDYKAYEYITITSATEFEVALTRNFPKAKTIALDDGVGSYIGDIVHDYKLNIIWTLLGRRKDKIWPVALYVNNVGFCKSTLSSNIKRLPSFDKYSDEYQRMILEMFYTCTEDVYRTNPIVYLTQPYGEIDTGLTKDIKKAEQVLKGFAKYGVVRKHPRDNTNVDIGYRQGSAENLWELICDKDITDSHILISICSTAQIMPKVLYGKEPWLIFIYDMFSYKYNSTIRDNFIQIVKSIKEDYTKPNKIFVPKSETELDNIIKCILVEENILHT